MASDMLEAVALAHANIALAKYWGKADGNANLPATPSLSLTLGELSTRTRVRFTAELTSDRVLLNGTPAGELEAARVVRLLDRVRARADITMRAEVESSNDFPTAAGLASSSSGFAALALAASQAAGLGLAPSELSALARSASASAARSIFGGFVALGAGASHAEPIAKAADFPLCMLVCVIRSSAKPMSSTAGMLHTQATSPYYRSWVETAPLLYREILDAIHERNIQRLGEAVEQNALMMHASMWAARPALNYFVPATLLVLARLRELQQRGLPAYATLDAGPNVKVLTLPEHAAALGRELGTLPAIERLLICHGGGGAQLVSRERS